MSADLERPQLLRQLNAEAPTHGAIEHVSTTPFGPVLRVERFRLANGLEVLVCEDHRAPVFAYHTWFRVGSRHERPGKTGLAHLFEHLMFNEMEGCPYGEFDRRLEEAGAENNAATWLDWTQYTIAAPADQLELIVGLEANRMARLVLMDLQVKSEKEVVANERRYRVEDDVEGSISELLWATAFDKHSYHWPTIGWMADIEGFTTADCQNFYRTFYAPNNATIVVVGDVTEAALLKLIVHAYGTRARVPLPAEDTWPEPPQPAERRVEVSKPTPTEKVSIGYHGPAFGDAEYVPTSLLTEVLFGGRASRMHRPLIRELEIASEVRAFVGPFRDPGLIEIFANARTGHTAEELLQVMDGEIERVLSEPVTEEELERARARAELALLAGLETVDGKASTMGFYDTLLGSPAAAFDRLNSMRSVTPSDLRRAARRYLAGARRTVVVVRAGHSADDPSQGDQSGDDGEGSE